MLAAKVLQRAGCEVLPVTFVSAFFGATQAKDSAAILNLPLIVHDLTAAHLQIVKHPQLGHGKNLNPCLDCRSLMLQSAERIRQERKAHILATGEVLGQRPFSQNKNAFARVEKIANLAGKILRPLSAQLLPATTFENEGLVEREQLEAISGRSRKVQQQLAAKFAIKHFPHPAGGCILTNPQFAQRGAALLESFPRCTAQDFQVLRLGRCFIFKDFFLVLGRNESENASIESFARAHFPEQFLLRMKNAPGPTCLLRFFADRDKIESQALQSAQGKILEFSKKASAGKIEFAIERLGS